MSSREVSERIAANQIIAVLHDEMNESQQAKPLGPRMLLQAALLAIPLSFATMVFKRQFCSCGPGWGWPFEIYSIVCGTSKDPEFMFNVIALAFDIAFWTIPAVLVLFIRAFFVWRKARHREENAEQPSGGDCSEAADGLTATPHS